MTSQSIYNLAIAHLREASTKNGILAALVDTDNYRRIWARDSVMAGLAGIVAEDEVIIQGLKNSLLTLFRNRNQSLGTIPSNVDPVRNSISYGSLAGRVDATTWFMIGAAEYYRYSRDEAFMSEISDDLPTIFKLLDAWEFNDRNLIYTPLSGNWADEYPIHGYLLYDNLLRYWALKSWSALLNNNDLLAKSYAVYSTIQTNFYLINPDHPLYHQTLLTPIKDENLPYGITGFHPGGAFTMFDCAANGLGLMLGFEDKVDAIESYITEQWDSVWHLGFVPAFWPPINEGDELWPGIANNHNYHFKNKPHHFHNGGYWPIMMGWMAQGLKKCGKNETADLIKSSYESFLQKNNGKFHEYIDSKHYIAGGIEPLSFSAAGFLLMADKKGKLFS